jgi:hypothetical protein
MALDAHLARSFRDRLKQLRAASPQGWEASRRLLVRSHVESTLKRLRSAVLGSTLPLPLREAVLAALPSDTSRHPHDRSGEALSDLTGLPPGKARPSSRSIVAQTLSAISQGSRLVKRSGLSALNSDCSTLRPQKRQKAAGPRSASKPLCAVMTIPTNFFVPSTIRLFWTSGLETCRSWPRWPSCTCWGQGSHRALLLG